MFGLGAKNTWILAALFYLISFFLGYHSITNRFHADSAVPEIDAHIYRNIVKDGLSAVNEDLRAGRLFIPVAAHAIYKLLPEKIGIRDVPLLALLLVNAFFCAGIGILIFKFAQKLGWNGQIAFISVLLFYLNFAVSHFYLSGLVDSGEGFCLLLLAYMLYHEKWKYIPLIAIWGVSIKETFFASSFALLMGWALVDFLKTKKITFERLLPIALYAVLGLLVFTATKSYSNGRLLFPWEYVHNIQFHDTWKSPPLSRIADGLVRFLYVYIWLIPLGIPKLKLFPREWLYGTGASCLFMFSLYIWVGADGSSLSRYLFAILGPILCISSSVYLNDAMLGLNRDNLSNFFDSKQPAGSNNK